jgi:PPOX class probable F420-dependent enzyme
VIPDTHRDLIERPIDAVLVTVMPDGQPQATVVWCSFDEPFVMINTMKGFRKEKNMRVNPKVSLLVVDPGTSSRWIEVRGGVELLDEGARQHLDELTALYTEATRYFGEVVPEELSATEVPVIGRITPVRVRAEAF